MNSRKQIILKRIIQGLAVLIGLAGSILLLGMLILAIALWPMGDEEFTIGGVFWNLGYITISLVGVFCLISAIAVFTRYSIRSVTNVIGMTSIIIFFILIHLSFANLLSESPEPSSADGYQMLGSILGSFLFYKIASRNVREALFPNETTQKP